MCDNLEIKVKGPNPSVGVFRTLGRICSVRICVLKGGPQRKETGFPSVIGG